VPRVLSKRPPPKEWERRVFIELARVSAYPSEHKCARSHFRCAWAHSGIRQGADSCCGRVYSSSTGVRSSPLEWKATEVCCGRVRSSSFGWKALLWARVLELNSVVLEPIFKKSKFSAFFPQNLNFSLNDLQNTKTSQKHQKITKLRV